MESNIKNDNKELFFASLNNFLEKENSIKSYRFFKVTKIFTELRKIPQVLNKNMPWINSGINAYNDSFDKNFAKLEPIIKQESQNCFSIEFLTQNEKFIYDFDELGKQISQLEGKSLDEYVSKKVNELKLYKFVDNINSSLDKEWLNDINNNYCTKSVKKEFEEKINEFREKNNDMYSGKYVIPQRILDNVLHIMHVVIPNINEKINEYNTDFNADFPYLNPVISKNSENSFTINFSEQDKQVTYDFDKLYKLINFKDYNLEYKNLEKEIGLYEFVSSIEDKLYTEWDKAIIDNCHFSESLDDVVEHELG